MFFIGSSALQGGAKHAEIGKILRRSGQAPAKRFGNQIRYDDTGIQPLSPMNGDWRLEQSR
jgi:hypothetical protein